MFEIPVEDPTRLQLARLLADVVRGTEVLLWVTDWPLYTKPEMECFLKLRASSGETRRLIDAPGHLFEPDSMRLIEYVFLMFKFNWEGYIFPSEGSLDIWLADEIVDIGMDRRRDRCSLVKGYNNVLVDPANSKRTFESQ